MLLAPPLEPGTALERLLERLQIAANPLLEPMERWNVFKTGREGELYKSVSVCVNVCVKGLYILYVKVSLHTENTFQTFQPLWELIGKLFKTFQKTFQKRSRVIQHHWPAKVRRARAYNT